MPPSNDFLCFSEVTICSHGFQPDADLTRRVEVYLLEDGDVSRDFGDDLPSKKRLHKNPHSLVFFLDAQLLNLFEHFYCTCTWVFSDPIAELGIRAVRVFIALILATACNCETAYSRSSRANTGLDGLRGCIRRPAFVRKLRLGLQIRSLIDGAPRHFILAAGFCFGIAILSWSNDAVDFGGWARRFRMATLVLLAFLLWRIFENVGGEAVAHIDAGALATGLTIAYNHLVLGDDKIGFGVLARAAQDELVNECVK